MYQNVYARVPGSAEMPSAGRAFSLAVLDALAVKGVERCAITLHTGVASLEQPEHPYEEWFEVSEEAADAINEHLQRGRIVAVGTTVVRALESAVDGSDRVTQTSGWTDLIITPEHQIRSVQGLITGFHEPKASHFGILAAFAGREHLVAAYGAALGNGYLWHEFGDLHLIL
jgi:S-adenosylmethionine:tRNA ribosyltransferase-isomerase